MFKMILSAVVALGMGSFAFADEPAAPAGDAPKADAPKKMGSKKMDKKMKKGKKDKKPAEGSN